MARFPFTVNLSNARAYYGPSLTDPKDQPQFWTNYSAKYSPTFSSQLLNTSIFAGAIGGIAAAGYIPFGAKRGWDYYVAGLRAFEEYSPAKIFRTFQLSNIFSPFETAVSKADLFLGPEFLKTNKQYTQYLSSLIGKGSFSRLLTEGVRLKSGRLFWGRGDVALKYASAIRTAGFGESANIGAAYARSIGTFHLKGTPPLERFFAAARPLKGRFPDVVNPLIGGYPAQIIGGKNIFQHTYRKFAALGTEQISRFNRLLSYFPVIGKRLAVKPSGGLEMLGRLSLKFGVGLGALSLGYEYLDWKARQSKLLDNTIFSEGITYGLASIPVGMHIRSAELSQKLGLSDYARKQEEIAPGSTSLLKLSAFPIMGAGAVAAGSYFWKVGKMAHMQVAEGISSSLARSQVEESFKTWGRFAKNIGTSLEARAARGGFLNKFIGRMTPTKFGMLVGAGIGLALVSPFIPGALFPQQTPEELRDIYSGKQEVPIRKGRWWELSRQPFEGSNISYFRKHAYALLGSRAREKAIWGEDYENLSPIERWYKKTFTYDIEKRHYGSRPYLISSLPFEDVPFVGPLLSSTLGRWIKPEIYMHCFAPDTLIRIENGWKAIGDIKIGDIVISGSNNVQKVLNIFINNKKDDSIEIFLASALKPIKVTKGHNVLAVKMPLCTRRGKGKKHQINSKSKCYCKNINITPEWFQIGNLEEWDYLIQKQPVLSNDIFDPVSFIDLNRWTILGNQCIRNTPNSWPKHSLDININDYEWGLLLGFYAAEGHLSNNGVSFCFNIKEDKYAETVKGLCQRISPNNMTSIYYRPEISSQIVNCSSTFLRDLLFNIHGEDKCLELLPEHFSREFCLGYIKGAFYGDGYFPVDKKVVNNVFINTRHSLTKTVQRFLLALGIVPKIYVSFNKDKKDCYSIYIRKCEYDFLFNHKDLVYKNAPYDFILNGFVYCRITKIQSIDLQTTIDIEVNEDHSYLVDDFIVHNSDQWLSDKGIKTQPPSFGARIATEVGQQPAGMPISPYSPSQVAGEEIYRIGTEMIGLTGFITASIKEKLTGSQDWFDKQAQLESAGRITSYEREYWEKELGGLFFTSEIWRRLFPHRKHQIDLYNPIRNTLPEWLSGPGEKGPDLLHGDPYSKIPWGEIRLPGPGYEVLHPELKGVVPEDYSPSWRLKILGDVAPYTEKYKQALIDARSARARKENWTEADEQRYQTTLKQVKQKKQRVEFQEYKYLSKMGDIFPGAKQESSELIARINEWKALQEQKPSLFQKYFGGYWELLSHNAETAFDQLTPISPGAKLVHQRTPIESYEREILYGSQAAFWQHPISHFIAPFGRSVAKTFGYEGVPESAQKTRDIETYFDILKYVKNARLSNLARIAGDTVAVKGFEKNKNETLFGINPFTRNYSNLYRALPRRERDYFSAFEHAETIEEKKRILEMVPENEKSLYVARWKLVHADELKKAKKAGILSEDQEAEADRQITAIYKEAKSEGFPTSEDLFAEYLQTKLPGENYADWYRRVKILNNIQGIPGSDWVGMHPSVDLEDIKLKLVQHLGEEPIPLNLWPSREKELPYKPYIDNEAIEPIVEPEKLSNAEIKARVNDLLFVDKMKGDVFITTTKNQNQNEVIANIDIEEDRSEEEQEQLVEVLNA